MLRLLQGDVGSGKTAVAAYALAAAARAGFQGALLAPTDLLARQHRDTVGALLEGAGRRRAAPDRLPQHARPGACQRSDRVGAGLGHRRHPRTAQRVGDVRASRAGDHRRAASVRGGPARPARGEGGWRRESARPVDDRHADPANARAGPLRRPRRVRSAYAAGRPHPDPHRDPRPGSPRRDVAEGPRGGRRRQSHVRRRAAHRGGQRRRRRRQREWGGCGRDRGGTTHRAARTAPRRARPRPDEARRPGRRDGAGSARASSTSSSARP